MAPAICVPIRSAKARCSSKYASGDIDLIVRAPMVWSWLIRGTAIMVPSPAAPASISRGNWSESAWSGPVAVVIPERLPMRVSTRVPSIS